MHAETDGKLDRQLQVEQVGSVGDHSLSAYEKERAGSMGHVRAIVGTRQDHCLNTFLTSVSSRTKCG